MARLLVVLSVLVFSANAEYYTVLPVLPGQGLTAGGNLFGNHAAPSFGGRIVNQKHHSQSGYSNNAENANAITSPAKFEPVKYEKAILLDANFPTFTTVARQPPGTYAPPTAPSAVEGYTYPTPGGATGGAADGYQQQHTGAQSPPAVSFSAPQHQQYGAPQHQQQQQYGAPSAPSSPSVEYGAPAQTTTPQTLTTLTVDEVSSEPSVQYGVSAPPAEYGPIPLPISTIAPPTAYGVPPSTQYGTPNTQYGVPSGPEGNSVASFGHDGKDGVQAVEDLKESPILARLRERIIQLGLNPLLTTDKQLERYLKGFDYNVERVVRYLTTTAIWRRTRGIDEVLRNRPSDYLTTNLPYECTGFTHEGEPIMYVPIGKWNFRTALRMGSSSEIYNYMVRMLEEARHLTEGRRNPKTGQPVDQAVFILDAQGYSLKNLLSKRISFTMLRFFKTVSRHYPFLAKKWFVPRTPLLIRGLWQIVRKVVSRRFREQFDIYTLFSTRGPTALLHAVPKSSAPVELGGTYLTRFVPPPIEVFQLPSFSAFGSASLNGNSNSNSGYN